MKAHAKAPGLKQLGMSGAITGNLVSPEHRPHSKVSRNLAGEITVSR